MLNSRISLRQSVLEESCRRVKCKFLLSNRKYASKPSKVNNNEATTIMEKLKLNLPSKKNRQDFLQIRKQLEVRKRLRSQNPSNVWRTDLKNKLKLQEGEISETNLKQQFAKALSKAAVTRDNVELPMAEGDVVTLNKESCIYYLVVSLPKKFGSNYYAFVNYLGEIQFGGREKVVSRFPRAIPDNLLSIVRNFIVSELKYKDMAPMGYPDPEFSKSEVTLQNQGKAEGNKTITKDSKDNLTDTSDDFILAGATSQVLINSDIATFIVPYSARSTYADALLELTLRTNKSMPLVAEKVKYLHGLLQFDNSGEVIDFPYTISMFELMEYVKNIDLDEAKEISVAMSQLKKNSRNNAGAFQDVIEKIKIIRESLSRKAFKKNLGKNLDSGSDEIQVPISTYLSILMVLRQNNRQWSFKDRPGYLPHSVTIIPSSLVNSRSNLIKSLKNEKMCNEFAEFVVSKVTRKKAKKPQNYYEIVALFKDFVAGNFPNDAEAQTLVGSILRVIEKVAKRHKVSLYCGSDPSFEYSKQRCYEVLQILKDPFANGTSGWENPIKWSFALELPGNNVSKMSDMGKDYYSLIDSLGIENQTSGSLSINQISSNLDEKLKEPVSFQEDFYSQDLYKNLRVDFSDIPIYCIDSATAHEIDDGISIQEDETGIYSISIHVANPSSYIKPYSSLASIAFQKGTTTYLPEGPSLLFPSIISEKAGLGVEKLTRTFVVQYKINKSDIQSFLSTPDIENFDILAKIKKDMEDSCRVVLGYGKKFPKGFTYNKVDEILNNETYREQFLKGTLKSEDYTNIYKLDQVATVLKNLRIFNGHAIEFPNNSNSYIQVDYEKKGSIENNELLQQDKEFKLQISGTEELEPIITIPKISSEETQNHGEHKTPQNKSQRLVSECMISANTMASYFAKINNIPIINRQQSMILNQDVEQELHSIVQNAHKNSTNISLENFYNMLPLISPARFSPDWSKHQSLGVDSYATVTSPLRRYADIVNHWMFEDFLLQSYNGKDFSNKGSTVESEWFRIDPKNLINISMHLHSREAINKQAQRFSQSFWTGVFLSQYVKMIHQGKLKSLIEFRLLINSKPKLGLARVQMIDFPGLKTYLMVEEENEPPRLGEVIKDVFEIVKLDYIEDELILRRYQRKVNLKDNNNHS